MSKEIGIIHEVVDGYDGFYSLNEADQKALEENESLDTFVAVAFYAQKMKDYDLAREMYGKAADAAKQAGGDNAQVEYDNYISMQKAVPIK